MQKSPRLDGASRTSKMLQDECCRGFTEAAEQKSELRGAESLLAHGVSHDMQLLLPSAFPSGVATPSEDTPRDKCCLQFLPAERASNWLFQRNVGFGTSNTVLVSGCWRV